ncbi:MAG: adenosylmethionine decarboxylase [Oligoflexales bacterium]|nr:adenosylmethionine decarboxylase [Oligoflexales bacterium]
MSKIQESSEKNSGKSAGPSLQPDMGFHGSHLFGELYGVEFDLLNSESLLIDILSRGVQACGATLCSLQSKKFDPQGVSVLALLSESHASVHSFPEKGALFFDIFTCGLGLVPEKWLDVLCEELRPSWKNVRRIERGVDRHHPSDLKYLGGLS